MMDHVFYCLILYSRNRDCSGLLLLIGNKMFDYFPHLYSFFNFSNLDCFLKMKCSISNCIQYSHLTNDCYMYANWSLFVTKHLIFMHCVLAILQHLEQEHHLCWYSNLLKLHHFYFMVSFILLKVHIGYFCSAKHQHATLTIISHQLVNQYFSACWCYYCPYLCYGLSSIFILQTCIEANQDKFWLACNYYHLIKMFRLDHLIYQNLVSIYKEEFNLNFNVDNTPRPLKMSYSYLSFLVG